MLNFGNANFLNYKIKICDKKTAAELRKLYSRMIIKKPKRLCIMQGCRNERRKGRKMCSRCTGRYYRQRDPEKAAYQNLQCNAKRRKKPCPITLEDFRIWCRENNYVELKGKKAGSASIDCIIDEIGYAKGNIRVLSLRNNTLKRLKKIIYDVERREYVLVETGEIIVNENLPF